MLAGSIKWTNRAFNARDLSELSTSVGMTPFNSVKFLGAVSRSGFNVESLGFALSPEDLIRIDKDGVVDPTKE